VNLIGLDRSQRLRLLQFVCSFAWADLEVHPREREFVLRLVQRLELAPEEAKQVQEWLELPPPLETVDPMQIPATHRKLFLAAIDGVIAADGAIAPEERESLRLLEQLLR
jgi:uncharacterized tellurite resistance protein B-like protein